MVASENGLIHFYSHPIGRPGQRKLTKLTLSDIKILTPRSMTPVILLVDDDNAWEFFLQRALMQSGVPASLQYVADGSECMEYLARKGAYQEESASPVPFVIILDLKMPGISGFRVLEWKREQPLLRSIPVVVFSSSDLEQDRKFALALGAVAYCDKPMNLKDLIPFVRSLEQYYSASKIV
jgi:CheY-like chemotaxis protein